jgi:hypothetical protein
MGAHGNLVRMNGQSCDMPVHDFTEQLVPRRLQEFAKIDDSRKPAVAVSNRDKSGK